MIFCGLHLYDWLVLGVYFAAMLWIGRATASSVHGQGDFYLAGRKLGRALLFFLNLGGMVDAMGAAQISSIVYNRGVGGVWIGLQTLFMTPYYWFMNGWFRRVRLTTVADLFIDRFGSRGRFLAVLYSVTAILFNVVGIGGSYLVTYKTLEVIVVKPESAYTAAEAERVARFHEFAALDARYRQGQLDPAEQPHYRELADQRARGEIRSSISYIHAIPFYLVYAGIVGVYVILGGMTAAAITDAVQGVLTILFSVILIPFGLAKLGGVSALAAKIPGGMLDLFGSGVQSEFAWYSIVAILAVSLVQIHAMVGNMAVSGSALDEKTAGYGALGGGLVKRLLTLAWCFIGLIAFALYGGTLSDPDLVWGTLCRSLLWPGVLGLMLAGLLAANMAHLSGMCLTLSALFVRNLFLPLFPRRTEQEGLLVGRILIAVILLSGIGVALFFGDLLAFAKMWLTLNVGFGAAILAMFKWRRVTQAALVTSVLATMIVVVGLPYAVPLVPALARHPALLLETAERREATARPATAGDVADGGAARVGQRLPSVRVVPPQPVFFDRIVRDPAPAGGTVARGEGRFQCELYLLSLAGVDVARLRPAQLLTLSYLFDTVFPFLLIFVMSLATRERETERAARFYAKMRTRVVSDPAQDAANVAAAQAVPAESERVKLFPASSWEFQKWNRLDYAAFFISAALSLGILGLLALLLHGLRVA